MTDREFWEMAAGGHRGEDWDSIYAAMTFAAYDEYSAHRVMRGWWQWAREECQWSQSEEAAGDVLTNFSTFPRSHRDHGIKFSSKFSKTQPVPSDVEIAWWEAFCDEYRNDPSLWERQDFDEEKQDLVEPLPFVRGPVYAYDESVGF